eukprot:4907437-Amphidinium_carterae.1
MFTATAATAALTFEHPPDCNRTRKAHNFGRLASDGSTGTAGLKLISSTCLCAQAAYSPPPRTESAKTQHAWSTPREAGWLLDS